MTDRRSWLRYRYQIEWCWDVWMWSPRWQEEHLQLFGGGEVLDLGPLEIRRWQRKQEAEKAAAGLTIDQAAGCTQIEVKASSTGTLYAICSDHDLMDVDQCGVRWPRIDLGGACLFCLIAKQQATIKRLSSTNKRLIASRDTYKAACDTMEEELVCVALAENEEEEEETDDNEEDKAGDE